MNIKKLEILIYALMIAFISGCTRPGMSIEQETERFHLHQDSFGELAEVSCDAREALDRRFYRYPKDVDGDEPESARQAFAGIDRLLDSIGLETVILRQFEEIECSLYVDLSGMHFGGEGYDFGYWYQPEDLGTYEYTEDFFSQANVEHREANRVRGEDPVRFSIELGNGWYLHYHSYP